VWVKEENGVRFITNKQNQNYLDTLSKLHRAAVENDLFEGARSTSKACVTMFRSWCAQHNIVLQDFNVFPGYAHLTRPKLDIDFTQVMPTPTRHPTQEEQQKFAELWISRYGKK
jgi:hypothetical protein